MSFLKYNEEAANDVRKRLQNKGVISTTIPPSDSVQLRSIAQALGSEPGRRAAEELRKGGRSRILGSKPGERAKAILEKKQSTRGL